MYTLESFYKSKEWIALKEHLMLERLNENGDLICEYCGRPITKKYDCIGHHEIELTDENVNNYDISLNKSNIKLIHFRCHNKIHERFEGFCRNVYLVYGPPCSGKSSWVCDAAYPDDLILDIDRLWEAICTSDKYHKPNRLKANAFGLRDSMLDQIRTRTGLWRNAYVVGGYPLASDRNRLCDLLNATPIFINESKDVCMSRAMTDDWKKYIEEWFDDYTE